MPGTANGSLDALFPADMAAKAEQVGVTKAHLPLRRLVPLGVLAGAFARQRRWRRRATRPSPTSRPC